MSGFTTTVTVVPHTDGRHCGNCAFLQSNATFPTKSSCGLYQEKLYMESGATFHFAIRGENCLNAEQAAKA
jgi:hypothetical protein